MTDADATLMYNACHTSLVCKHLFDQELSSSFTRFNTVARTLIPGWPVTLAQIQADVAKQDTLITTWLNAHAASNECGFNQWSPRGQCIFLAPFEHTNPFFVQMVFALFIVIGIFAGVRIFVKSINTTEDDDEGEETDALHKPPLTPSDALTPSAPPLPPSGSSMAVHSAGREYLVAGSERRSRT